MRSRITIVIILISIVLLIFATVRGIKIGDFKILSISELVKEDEELQKKIEEASELTSKNYPDNVKNLEETFKEYTIQKEKYEDLVDVTNKNNKEVYETKQYDISYLWRVLGSYATEQKYAGDEGLVLNIDVRKSNIGTNIYDFNFTVSGEYTRISQFVLDIENDSDLYFRIYNFKMVGQEVQYKDEQGHDKKKMITIGTFTVKNISIDPATIAR